MVLSLPSLTSCPAAVDLSDFLTVVRHPDHQQQISIHTYNHHVVDGHLRSLIQEQALQQLIPPEKGAPFIQKKGSGEIICKVSFSGFFCCRSMICRLKYILYPAADAVWSAELSSFCGWLPESMS